MSNKKEMLALELKRDLMSLDTVSEGLKDTEEEEDEVEEEAEDSISGWETQDGETATNSDSENEVGSTLRIGEQETSLVTRSRAVVFTVLFLAASLCAFGTFWYTSRADHQVFEQDVENFANEIHTISQISATQVFGVLRSMTTTVTSYARSTNSTWPFVVVDDFGVRGKQLLSISGSSSLGFLPILHKSRAEEWRNFTIETNAGLDVAKYGEVSTEISGGYGEFDYYAPLWQREPVNPSYINRDFFRPERQELMLETRDVSLVSFFVKPIEETDFENEQTFPTALMSAPIFDSFEADSNLVAYFSFRLLWYRLYRNILPDGTEGIHVVINAMTCPDTKFPMTYQLDGPEVVYLGPEDLHDPEYDHLEFAFKFDVSNNTCDFDVRIYPSSIMEEDYKTNKPIFYTLVVVMVFVITSLVFIVYDWLVEKRQTTVMTSAEQTGALVSSLFPSQFRDRLLNDAAKQKQQGQNLFSPKSSDAFLSSKVQSSLSKSPSDGTKATEAGSTLVLAGNDMLGTKPLAELFPCVTVMFGDISGFTAWSSVREPAQVFTLLEQIYSSFDVIAKRRKIFKVETIGDCYVAAAGLPEACDDHAVIMARFATQCRYTMNYVVSKLEVLLGPDTADLTMRFGLHSGPVTAGVLRGEKCRFQLFGDTINTASRIESTGESNMIHISEDTAELLMTAGHADWITPRDSMVSAKGKGAIQTYWLTMKRRHCHVGSVGAPTKNKISDNFSDGMSQASGTSVDDQNMLGPEQQRTQRLVEWMVEVLHSQLQKIVAMRSPSDVENCSVPTTSQLRFTREEGKTILDEVLEIIPLSEERKSYHQNPQTIQLDAKVLSELRNYVTTIASMYHDNCFHSFEHASHVTMSVTKLLSRVVTIETIDKDFQYKRKSQDREAHHEYTYGITSDPLIQFACAISALIHDVDHQGIPNSQLIKENTEIAELYGNKSVAEQNSVDLAWGLLMEPTYDTLRSCLCKNQEELNRFRHLIVNCVMATDIVDKDLGALRKKRWNKAFSLQDDDSSNILISSTDHEVPHQDDTNRKATIVIEHIIQASDVSHTMQHWHVYLKWNERFFHECYKAFLEGRATEDPSKSWYQGELGFFDFYIIPLARKLKQCCVFGVASDEYLTYARANRQEWELKGKEVVQGYLAKYAEDA